MGPWRIMQVNSQDFDGRTPLHYAARNGQLLVVHFLLFSCADTMLVDRRGATPLLDALETGNLSCATVLAATGAPFGPAGEARHEELKVRLVPTYPHLTVPTLI